MDQQLPGEEFSLFEYEYQRAETGKRLLNYILDVVLFYLLLFILGMLLAVVSPDTIDSIANQNSLLDRFITLCCYALYMSIVEAAFKGKSLGKLITRTRAINLDGTSISFKTAFARGFSRAVPFCVFSAFGSPCNPWQDRWTNTLVIDEKKSNIK